MLSIVMPVILVNKGIEKMTIQAIDSVYGQTLGDWELIVVVHGGEFFKFKIDFPRFKIIEIERRLGIAEAYNLGFNSARGNIFCCLHNDIRLSFGWNYLLEEVARRGDIGFPMVNEDYSLFDDNLGILPTKKYQPPACCFMFSRLLWKKLNGFDENFKELHGEDIDFFKRAENAGRELVRCDVTVLHYRGATRSLLADGGNSALLRNIKLYNLKHSDGKDMRIILPRISDLPEERMEACE